MPRIWTQEQQQAISTRGGTVLVSAAAGSGKTAVLTERVIQRITGPQAVDADRFLVVTFTRAAAAEMRSRIADRLRELIDGLSLLLSGNCGSIFIAAHTALETLCGGLRNRLCNGKMIKVIPSGLGEEEDMLIAPCAAVFYAFRHGVFLHPDDVVAKIPAGVPQGEGQQPRDTDHIFGLAALNLVVEGYGLSVSSVGIFRIDKVTLIAFSGIGIGDVEPECSVRTKNAPDFRKYIRQARYIFFRCCLPANLPIHTVIPQRVIRWGCHTAVDTFIRQRFQHLKAIAGINCIKLYLAHSFRS